ncbi:MAG: T9SS type A sorting domain-containing protein [Chitinophagales bacterium]
MNKLLLSLSITFHSLLLVAQPTVNQSTYDLQFAEQVVDCENTTPIFCVSIQIKSAIEGENFRIGSHTVFFSYNPLTLQSPTYTSSNFDNTNLCLTGDFAAYNTPAFGFDDNTSEANFTTIAQQTLTTQLCPLVTNSWQEMGLVCFEVINDITSSNLLFDSNLTTINYIDPNATNNIGDPQDKAAHTQGTLSGLNVLPTCPCNQTIVQTTENVQEFCGSGMPDLAAAENEIQYSGDGSIFSIEWFIDVDYNTPYIPETFTHSEIGICEQESFILYAKATCSIDATEYDAGTLEAILYPLPQMPEIVRLDDECAYLVLPACPNDLLSETTFDLMPSAEAANRNLTVTSPFNPTCTANFEVPYEKCPDPVCDQTITQTTASLQSFCEIATPDLTLAEAEIAYSGDGTVFTIKWFEDQMFTIPYLNQSFQHSQSDLCVSETDTLFAKGICNIDNTSIAAGFLAFVVYPPVQMPEIVRLDDACAYQVLPVCANDVLSETSFSLLPDTEIGLRTIEVTSGLAENTCTSMSFNVPFEACPMLVCSQTILQNMAATESFCESGFPDLTAAESELQFSGDGSVFSIEWFEDQNFTLPYGGELLTHSMDDVCQLETKILYARATCSEDASTITAGTLTVQLFPNPQTPIIERIDEECTYQILPACLNDLLSEATFNLPPDTESGLRTIEVTSGLNENPCTSMSFDIPFEACPMLVCSQMILQNMAAIQSFCESGTADLTAAESELQFSGDGSVFSIEWFEDQNFTLPYGGELLTHSMDDVCQLETKILYARATCSEDASTIAAGTLTVQLFPNPQTPIIERIDNECTYQILPACLNDLLSETTFNLPPDTESGLRTIEVTSDLAENTCTSMSFDVPFEACPMLVCSQTILQNMVATESFCESGFPDLTAAESELQFSGDGSVFSIEWFEDQSFTLPYGGELLTHSMDDVCQLETKILYARATCSEDASTIAAGTLTIQLFPNPQMPTIERIDNECTYQILPACLNDLLSETTFNLPPDTESGLRTIEVTSGIENNVCGLQSFEVTYDACPPAFCNLEVVSAIPSMCDSTTNTYSLEVVVTYGTLPNAPIAVFAGTFGTGGGTIDGSGEQVFVLEDLPANGEMNVTVVAGLVINSLCEDTLFNAYNAPISCKTDLCEILNIGEMPSENQFVCSGDLLQINHLNTMLPDGMALAYILHSTPNNAITNPLYFSNVPTFDFAAIPELMTGISYYVTAVGGFDMDENGFPELENNECLKLSNPTPVVFLNKIGIDFEVFTDETNQTFDLNVTVSGGLPDFNASNYQISLSNGVETVVNAPFQMVVLEDMPLMEELLSISVTDNADCSATEENIAVGVEMLSFLENFEVVYLPNHLLQLQFWTTETQILDVFCYDMIGRPLQRKRVSLQQGFQTFDWSLVDLPDGVYLLQLNNGRESFVKKIVRY